ncbi:MAG: UDP-N-acetylmuramoyl-L-alanine--D-glutamate ligase [Gammaproteobacteria bacterium]|nr:UDP-N-acetylmuramoyl-L-alanine--D-glutamate ligase [Gammaproteobacteria bacterium]
MAARRTDSQAAPVRTVLVLGMGATGASVARHLAARGQLAWFADTREAPPGLAAIHAAMAAAGLMPGALPSAVPAGVTQVVVSPGADLDLPVLADARRLGLPVLSDIDLFAQACRAPVLGITGSNGKSTVTSMVGAMLQAAGWQAGVGGNLGTPALDLLDAAARAYVLELSSFQLERSAPLSLQAAVVLNVAPDHLDRHGTMAVYTAAKARIYAACAVAIVNRDEAGLADLVPRGTPVIGYGLGAAPEGDYGLRVGPAGESLARGTEILLPVRELGPTGRHNVSNALAALALAQAAGVERAACLQALRQFRGLPHRCQVVASRDGITWIDDSKATNVAAAVTSIRGVAGPLVLIAGGDGKGQAFDQLAAALRGRDATAILIGRDRDAIARALAGTCTVVLAANLPEAVGQARAAAAPGGSVLLAPACSSLDMFHSYAHRGQVFADAVQGGQQ